MNTTKCVVLNATYEPIDILPSQNALVLCLQDKAYSVADHDVVYRSQHLEVNLPAVIALRNYVSGRQVYSTTAILTQRNLFTRDGYKCQYCGRNKHRLSSGEILTRDHVHPRAKGGPDKWDNVVTACSTCNNRKGDFWLRDVNMELLREPYAPTVFELFSKSKINNEAWDKVRENIYWNTKN